MFSGGRFISIGESITAIVGWEWGKSIVYLEGPVHDHLVGGVVLAEDVELDVLNVLAEGQEVGKLLLSDELLHRVLPFKVISQPVVGKHCSYTL